MASKRGKVIILVAGAVVLCLGFLYYAALAPALLGKDRVARAFAAGLRDAMGLDLRYESSAFRLLPRPSVALRRVVVGNAVGKEIVRADEVKVGLSYFGFVTLRPHVAALDLFRPRVDLAGDDVRFGADAKAPAFRGTIIVREGFVRYGGKTRTAFADGLNGRVRCKAQWGKTLDLRGKLAAEKLSFAAGGGEPPAGGMAVAAEGRVRYEAAPPGGRVFLDGLHFLFGKAKLTAEGEIGTGPGEKDVDVSLTGRRMALAQVLPALVPRLGEAELGGELDLTLKAKGKWGEGRRPDVRGELTITKGELQVEDGEGISAFVAKVRFLGDEYLIENFQGQTKRGGFKGSGKIVPDKNWPFELTAEGPVPLEALALVLGVPEGYMLAGPADLNLDVAGELGKTAATTADGTIQLGGCRVRVKPFVEPFRDLTGTVNCDGYKFTTGKVKGRIGGGDFELGGSWQGFETPRLELVVIGGDVNLDAALPAKEKTKHEVEGAAPPLPLPGRNIEAKGTIKFKSCKLLRVAAKNPEADFEYAGGVFNLKKLNFDAYDGKVQSQATIYPGPRPRYTFSASVKDARLGVFLTENKWLANVVTGKFSADVVFSAEGTKYDDVKKTFGGKGSLELAGGRVAGLPLLAELVKWSRISYYEPLQVSKLWATADANAGVVRTADFKIENPDMTVEAAGEVDLEKKLNFVVKTTFEKKAAERLAREGKALALVRDDDGRAHFNFVVTGEAAKPAFQLEASSMLGAAGVPAPGAGTAETGVEGDIF